jgi:uncharacterized protein YceH (UPF0502 family)
MNHEDPFAGVTGQSEQPELSALESRILGALMEKQRTTPDYYPMTLNALVQACNQKTSRNPIMSLTPGEVGHAVNLLRDRELIGAGFSGRAERYEQKLARVLNLDRKQQALLCILMLRGSQTLGELRSNSARMAEFSDLGEVRETLENLMGREPPLIRCGRAPGHREERYNQMLCADAGPDPATLPPDQTLLNDAQRVDALERQITQLRNELDALWRLTGLEKDRPGSE